MLAKEHTDSATFANAQCFIGLRMGKLDVTSILPYQIPQAVQAPYVVRLLNPTASVPVQG